MDAERGGGDEGDEDDARKARDDDANARGERGTDDEE